MKTLIITLLLIGALSSQAQKFEQIKDKFTGKTTYYTHFETIHRSLGANGDAGEKLQFAYFKFNDSLFFYLETRQGGNKLIQINQGQKLLVRFSGSDIFTTLLAYSNQVSQIEQATSVNATTINQLYYLDPETTKLFRANDIEVIRMEHATGQFEWDIKDKYSSLPRKILSK